MSLSAQWEHLLFEFLAIENTELPSSNANLQKQVRDALVGFQSLQVAVDNMGTFSRNEELDDVHTLDLKYLLIPFYVAELLSKLVDGDRYGHLKLAKAQLGGFIAKCQNLNVLPEQEFEKLAHAQPTDRQGRIDHLKKDKELAARLAGLEQAKQRAAKRSKEDTLEDNSEFEELEREYQLLQLERALRLAFDKRTMCDRELELLALTQEQKAEAVAARDEAQAEARRNPTDPIRLVPSAPTERQRILDAVFQPRNLPTMTIEEYMQAHPEEFTAAPQAPQPSKNKEDADEEDDDEEVYRKRAWDDWKDDHPRGWGNRKGNVG
eukprot:EG_transcript_19107